MVWALGDGELSIEWIESGMSDVQAPTRRGFGSRMIAMNVSHDLRGRTTTDWRQDGMTFHLAFSVDEKDM